MLTAWKQPGELAFLNEVSAVPLQQCLRHLTDTHAPMPATTLAVGIDAGLTHLITLSTGEQVANPRHERADRARLARAQRELARKGSRNRAKARLKVARVHARIADRRRDHLHKLSTRLVRENQTLVIEELTVRSMLTCKAGWYGRDLVVIDRLHPSSKLCSACGSTADANAARNILAAGLAVTACEAGVRPQRETSRTRRPAVKQETRG